MHTRPEASGFEAVLHAAWAGTKGILNHCRYPLQTGRPEGINKIEMIERQAYRFRDNACFVLKIKGAFSGSLLPDPR
jgi:transposase